MDLGHNHGDCAFSWTDVTGAGTCPGHPALPPGACNPLPTGETRLRDALLRGGGFVVVAVPYHEWDALRGVGERDDYLRSRLAAGVAGGRG